MSYPKQKKVIKRIGWILLTVFILMNFIAYVHAYKFTHFSGSVINKTKDPKNLSTTEKLKTLFLGIDNPRPVNIVMPTVQYDTIKLQSNKTLEGWYIKADSAKGTFILFHGYCGNKSSMLGRSYELIKQGYNVLLVDFMGSGGSEGNGTTIGFKEAEEVKTCFDYITLKGESNVYLLGTSMGAVAIMKAIKDYAIFPKAIIIECPFGSMYKTTCARFNNMKIPSFPMAALLDFWGGIQNGFWAFSHNPTEYAKAIKCPALLIYGDLDDRVSRGEIDEIYNNLKGKKALVTFPLAGHADYLTGYKIEWLMDIQIFIKLINQ
jgi:uncharacterized protein